MESIGSTGQKSFWERPEGTTGMIAGVALLGLGVWGLAKLLPLITDAFYAAILGLALLALIYVTVIDGTLRNRLWMAYKLLMRALTGMIIPIDPIGILKNIGIDARKKLEKVEQNRNEVAGQVSIIEQTMATNGKDLNRYTKEADVAMRSGNEMGKAQAATKMGRLMESNEQLGKTREMIRGYEKNLTRAYDALVIMQDNIDFELQIREREYKAVKATHQAVRAMKAVFSGSAEMNALRDQTLEYLAEDYGRKLGDIDAFMHDSEKFINSVDLQNAVYQDDALKLLDKLNNTKVISVEKRQELPAPSPAVDGEYTKTSSSYIHRQE